MVSYEEFEKLCKQMPEAPGINLLGRVQGEVVFPGQNEELSFERYGQHCHYVAGNRLSIRGRI